MIVLAPGVLELRNCYNLQGMIQGVALLKVMLMRNRKRNRQTVQCKVCSRRYVLSSSRYTSI
jgi:hypothetical protein